VHGVVQATAGARGRRGYLRAQRGRRGAQTDPTPPRAVLNPAGRARAAAGHTVTPVLHPLPCVESCSWKQECIVVTVVVVALCT
jgi:hypothetical protein